MNLSFPIRQRFFDSNGLPLAGGQLYTYQAGTTTPQVTYLNQSGTTNTNPVILDAYGYCDLWLDPSVAYKFVLEDVNGNVQWTVDQVSYYVGISTWNSNTIYAQYQLAADPNSGMLYVSLVNNNQGNALTNVSSWRAFGGQIRTVSSNTSLIVTDELLRSNSTSGNLVHTLPGCSTTPIGKRITIKDVGTAGNYTQVKGNGSDMIDENNTWATNLLANSSATFENNGSSWDSLASTMITTPFIAAQAVTAAKIANATITTTQISATAGITGTQLAAGTITATELSSNINLPGKPTVGTANAFPVVSLANNTANIAVARGQVNSSGGLNYGEGLTPSLTASAGIYTITFSPAFADIPAVCITCSDNAAKSGSVYGITSSGCTVVIFSTTTGSPADADFSIIAMGQN